MKDATRHTSRNARTLPRLPEAFQWPAALGAVEDPGDYAPGFLLLLLGDGALGFQHGAQLWRHHERPALEVECLNVHQFASLADAKAKIETWRLDYTQRRPHSSLGDLTLNEFMRDVRQCVWPRQSPFLVESCLVKGPMSWPGGSLADDGLEDGGCPIVGSGIHLNVSKGVIQ